MRIVESLYYVCDIKRYTTTIWVTKVLTPIMFKLLLSNLSYPSLQPPTGLFGPIYSAHLRNMPTDAPRRRTLFVVVQNVV